MNSESTWQAWQYYHCGSASFGNKLLLFSCSLPDNNLIRKLRLEDPDRTQTVLPFGRRNVPEDTQDQWQVIPAWHKNRKIFYFFLYAVLLNVSYLVNIGHV